MLLLDMIRMPPGRLSLDVVRAASSQVEALRSAQDSPEGLQNPVGPEGLGPFSNNGEEEEEA